MKIFKFSAMVLLLILFFGSCKKDTLAPSIKKNYDTDNSVNSRSRKSDLPEFIAKSLLEYDQVAESLGLQSFNARWGAVKTGTRIYSTNSKNDNLIIFPMEGDLGQRNLLVGAYNKNTTGVFVISENAILTEENIKGTPFDIDFQRIFNSSSDGVLAGIESLDLPDGCYEWTGGNCMCFIKIPCPSGGGGDGDGDGDGDPGAGDTNPINGDGDGGIHNGGVSFGHYGFYGGFHGGGVNIDYANKYKLKILALKSKYNLGPKMTQWLIDHANIFLDKELAAYIEEKIAKIVALQLELGFDDVVAEYILQNAPDGADDKDLMALAMGYFGGKVTHNPNVTSTLEFNSIQEYGVFISAVINNSSYPVAYTQNTDNYIAAIQYPLSGDLGTLTWGVELVLDVGLKTTLTDYKVNSVTTNTYGLVNPWSWEQVGVQKTQSNDDPNIQEIKVLGTQYIGVKIKSFSFSIDFDWSLFCDQDRTSGKIVKSFHRPGH